MIDQPNQLVYLCLLAPRSEGSGGQGCQLRTISADPFRSPSEGRILGRSLRSAQQAASVLPWISYSTQHSLTSPAQ